MDNASTLLAVYDGACGGTGYTVGYALQQRRKVIRLDVVGEGPQSYYF